MEEWKPVKGYEGLYEVSNMGRVKSLNYRRTGKEGILKPIKNTDDYLHVPLWKEGRVKWCYVHRLVSTAFLDNPDNLPCINHKDENPENNKVENLEWCNVSYNNSYNGRAKRVAKKVAEKLSKPIIGVDRITGLIVEFASAREAERKLGINNYNICKCLKGRRKSAGGFLWFYAE